MVNWVKKLFRLSQSKTRSAFIAEHEKLSTPWAMFEVRDFPTDGQVKIEFSWNQAFINHISALGFQAETPEDAVQLFFYTSQMKPTELSGDDPVQAEATPALSAPSNRFVA